MAGMPSQFKRNRGTAMKASYVSERFASALPYNLYLQAGTSEQQRRWAQVYDLAHLTAAQNQLVGGFERDMKVLVYSGIWCGDCVQQGPLIHRIAEANPAKIDLRFIERPMSEELPGYRLFYFSLKIGIGARLPGIAPSIVTAPWLLADSAQVAPRESSHRKRTSWMPRSAIG
jgi:thiol-disulfide isomerase/thioredoxin